MQKKTIATLGLALVATGVGATGASAQTVCPPGGTSPYCSNTPPRTIAGLAGTDIKGFLELGPLDGLFRLNFGHARVGSALTTIKASRPGTYNVRIQRTVGGRRLTIIRGDRTVKGKKIKPAKIRLTVTTKGLRYLRSKAKAGTKALTFRVAVTFTPAGSSTGATKVTSAKLDLT